MIRIAWWLLTGFWLGGHKDEGDDEGHEHDWSVWSFPAIAEWTYASGDREENKKGNKPLVACQSRACIECGEVEVRWLKAWSPELESELKKLSPSLTEDGQCSSRSIG